MYKFQHIAKFYDLFSQGLNKDIKFYIEEAKKCKGKVLEVAVGTGRIFLPMLKNKVDAYGFDISDGMLEMLKQKAKKQEIDVAGRLSKKDMRTFKYNQKFDLITIPYRAFLHNSNPEEQLATLKQCYKHLNKNGRLIINFYLPNPASLAKKLKKNFKEEDYTVKRKNYSVRLIGFVTQDYLNQHLHITYYFHEKTKGKPITVYKDEFTMTWIGMNEFKDLAKLANFKIEKLYGDFKRNPVKNIKTELVWVLKK